MAGMALAAGAGNRLRPLTLLLPKPLCPVGGVPLLDHTLAAMAPVVGAMAVNAHHLADLVADHVARAWPDAHLSVEEPDALGTAGAVGQLRGWLDGRAVLVANADTWHQADLADLIDGWDGERVRVLQHGREGFGPRSRIVASLLPSSDAVALTARPSGLYEVCWAPAHAAGRLEVLTYDGPFADCATPADYLRANLLASGGGSVVPDTAQVLGRVERTVLWPDTVVWPAEHLVNAIRTPTSTILIR